MFRTRVVAAAGLLLLASACGQRALGAKPSSDAESESDESEGDTRDGDASDGDAASDDGDPTSGGDGTDSGPDPSTTGGDGCRPYGAPDPDCCDGEDPIVLAGIEGSFCAPICSGGIMCPPTDYGQAQCALGTDPAAPSNCAILCDLAAPDCPPGASCEDAGANIGICTYP